MTRREVAAVAASTLLGQEIATAKTMPTMSLVPGEALKEPAGWTGTDQPVSEQDKAFAHMLGSEISLAVRKANTGQYASQFKSMDEYFKAFPVKHLLELETTCEKLTSKLDKLTREIAVLKEDQAFVRVLAREMGVALKEGQSSGI